MKVFKTKIFSLRTVELILAKEKNMGYKYISYENNYDQLI